MSKGFERHGIPLDFLWLDLEHTHGKRYFTWDPRHFPEHEVQDMLQGLNRTHRKLVTIIDPHLQLAQQDLKGTCGGSEVRGGPQLYRGAGLSREAALDPKAHGWRLSGLLLAWQLRVPRLLFSGGKGGVGEALPLRGETSFEGLFLGAEAYPGYAAELYTWNDMNEPSVFDGPEITLPKDTLHRCDGPNATVEHRQAGRR